MSAGGVPDDVFVALIAAAEDAAERIRTCHERVACPKCDAPIGERCRRMPAGFVGGVRGRDAVVGPHRERWTLVQPDR